MKLLNRKMIRKFIHGLLLIYLTFFSKILLFSQTTSETELHNRYWNYRENFRKYFNSIGIGLGQSLPYSDIDNYLGINAKKVNNLGVNDGGDIEGLRGRLTIGGDVTAYFAEYLGVLASEYWLLKNQERISEVDLFAVKSELYFALKAIERLDKGSKFYYESISTDEIDGFFIRDDEEPITVNYFNNYNYPLVTSISSIPLRSNKKNFCHLCGKFSIHT
jgi:hypothetical protein